MKFIGIDLAWTYKNETGVCIISDNGTIECLISAILSNEEIVDLIKQYCHEPICVAIDAPLIVKNENGSREAERSLMAHKIHGYNLSLFVASRSFLTRTFGEIRGEVLLDLLIKEFPDIEISTMVSEEKSTVIETFPSAICCGLFSEIYPVKYKLKKKVPYAETMHQMKRLVDRLNVLENHEGIVNNLLSRLLPDNLVLNSKNHKHIEDKVDAFLSAYCVFSIYKRISKPLVFGDVSNGFITIAMAEDEYKHNVMPNSSRIKEGRKLMISDIDVLRQHLGNLSQTIELSKKEQIEVFEKFKKELIQIESELNTYK